MPLVRTTFRETPFEMSDEEAELLRGQGLIAEITGAPGPAAPADGSPDRPDTPDGGPAPDGPTAPKSTAKPKETK